MNKAVIVKQQTDYYLQSVNQQQKLESAWFAEKQDNSFDYLDIGFVLNHLTSMEADLAMLNYFRALKVGGTLSVSAKDADYYLQLWQQAVWNEAALRDSSSACRQAFAGLWGVQQGGNPRDEKYSATEQGVFKSGYNSARLHFLLERAGFVDIHIGHEQGILLATARKSMNKGERQVASDYANIRPDHINRYRFACEQLKSAKPAKILDLACGIGYGSLMLQKETGADVIGVDVDSGAIEYAKTYYSGSSTQFICKDARELQLEPGSMDAVVSFETIEHVDFDRQLLSAFYKFLKPDGLLICSTPNQDVMPFDKEKFAFHLKHYRNAELVALLEDCGFSKILLFKQDDAKAAPVVSGQDGCFTIVVARR